MKTVGIDRDGNLAIHDSFNFKGTLGELKDLIAQVIEEVGEDTKCRLHVFRSFPHRCDSHIILVDYNEKEVSRYNCGG